MVSRSSIEFAELAVTVLEDIIAWYVDQQVPEVGKRLVGDVVAQVERRADFPESRRIVPEFELPNLCEIIYRRFGSSFGSMLPAYGLSVSGAVSGC